MDAEDDFDLSDITTEDEVMAVFEEDEWGTSTEAAMRGERGGGRRGRASDLEALIDVELVRLKDKRFLEVNFVKKARETTPLPDKCKFIRESICKFIEDGEGDIARLGAAIENENTFKIISNSAIGIRKTAHRIGARGLWSIADAYVKYSESDERSRGELLPKYEVMKKEFNDIKNEFRANLLEHAHTAEARLVVAPPPITNPPVPPT